MLLVNGASSISMLEMTLHLTRSTRLLTFQLLGFELFQVRLQKKPFQPFL
jgi:hypothetical protein